MRDPQADLHPTQRARDVATAAADADHRIASGFASSVARSPFAVYIEYHSAGPRADYRLRTDLLPHSPHSRHDVRDTEVLRMRSVYGSKIYSNLDIRAHVFYHSCTSEGVRCVN